MNRCTASRLRRLLQRGIENKVWWWWDIDFTDVFLYDFSALALYVVSYWEANWPPRGPPFAVLGRSEIWINYILYTNGDQIRNLDAAKYKCLVKWEQCEYRKYQMVMGYRCDNLVLIRWWPQELYKLNST